MLAKTAGVKHLIVLINKMDDPTVNWSLERSDKKNSFFLFVFEFLFVESDLRIFGYLLTDMKSVKRSWCRF